MSIEQLHSRGLDFIDGKRLSDDSARVDDPEVGSLNLLDLSPAIRPQGSEVPVMHAMPVRFAGEALSNPLETPAEPVKTAAAEDGKLYPELVLARQAMEVFKDSKLEAKERFEKANALFHQAEMQIEKYIEYQGGTAKMYANAAILSNELFRVMGQFLSEERSFRKADGQTNKDEEEKLREQIKSFTRDDLLQALRGGKGEELRSAMFNVLDDDEKEMIAEIELIQNKIQIHSSLKVQHALVVNEHAILNKDQTLRILSENILKSIAAVDAEGFRASPEVQGLLIQSQGGEKMDLSEGKALALAFCEEAKKTIIRSLTGVDALFNADLRTQGAAQAIRLLAAALAANSELTLKSWNEWQESSAFPFILQRAKELIGEKTGK